MPSNADQVSVCVIDSGIDYTHEDLRDNMHPLIGYNALTGEVRGTGCMHHHSAAQAHLPRGR